MAAVLAAWALVAAGLAPAGGAVEPPTVTLAVVQGGIDVEALARDGMSVGLMSAGLGEVSAERTFRDISVGNREPPPSDAVPGLLESTLAREHLAGRFRRISVGPGELADMASGLMGDDLLIAFGAPPPAPDHALPIGIAGSGFDGTLGSDSTRTDGYVISTDIAPTVLTRFGLAIPDQMDGEPIRAEGAVDPGAVEELGARMAVIPERRGPLLIACLASWIALAAAVAVLMPPARRAALAWLALAFAYMPLALLVGAALEPGALLEGLIVGIGAAALAAVTLRVLPGWWAVAVACAVTVLAYAIDVIAGSELTRLSLLGSNPIYGARFYGIGNELEALFAVMIPAAVGAGLTAAGAGRTAAGEGWPGTGGGVASFLGVAALGAIVFGAGRFGADVGAAIVLPIGAAVAAGAVASSGRIATTTRQGLIVATVIVIPLAALVAVVFIDLVSGGDTHLTRTVLDAGGAGDLADTAERRLRLSADDFVQAAENPLFWLVVAGLVAGITQWRRIDAWLAPSPHARAGLVGACAAVAVGVLVNDSGATFLTLGGLALGAVVAYACAQARRGRPRAAGCRSGK